MCSGVSVPLIESPLCGRAIAVVCVEQTHSLSSSTHHTLHQGTVVNDVIRERIKGHERERVSEEIY